MLVLIVINIEPVYTDYVAVTSIICDEELFLWNDWPTKCIYALIPAGTIVTGSHHHKLRAGFESLQNLSS